MKREPVAEIPRGVVRFYNFLPVGGRYPEDVLSGLAQPRKRISQRYCFDEKGARLYAAVCAQAECYLVRTEVAILRESLDAIVRFIGPDTEMIELRPGAGVQSALLLDRLRPLVYVPVDVDRQPLDAASRELAQLFPWLNISAMYADFCDRFAPPEFVGLPIVRKAVYLPGSVIGGFEPEQALAVLRSARRIVGRGGAPLAGVDLKKNSRTIVSAYNDAKGMNAALHLNLLERINRELGGDFQPARFSYRTSYDADRGRLETFLQSRYSQMAHVAGRRFDFALNETIETGIACQYSIAEFQALAGRAGFAPQAVWTDDSRKFSMHGLIAG